MSLSDTEPHVCFTASTTAYLRNLDRDDIAGRHVAIHYQPPPKKTEGGMSIGMRTPILLMTLYLEKPDEVAEKIAKILNDHWEEYDA